MLRCHISLVVPENTCCGLWVDGVEQFHEEGSIIVFDDSKTHFAFNRDKDIATTSYNEESEELIRPQALHLKNLERDKTDRIVLIIDILRPSHLPLGGAVGGHTPELDDFISQFR